MVIVLLFILRSGFLYYHLSACLFYFFFGVLIYLLCNLVKNDPVKIIGYNFDEDEKNSFSPNLNSIFNENLNLLEDFAKLQFVKN